MAFVIVTFLGTNARANDERYPPVKRLGEAVVSLLQHPVVIVIGLGALAAAVYFMRPSATQDEPSNDEVHAPNEQELEQRIASLSEACERERQEKEACLLENEELQREIEYLKAFIADMRKSQAESDEECFRRLRMKDAELDDLNRKLTRMQENCQKLPQNSEIPRYTFTSTSVAKMDSTL